MVESVDTADLKSAARKGVRVRVSVFRLILKAHSKNIYTMPNVIHVGADAHGYIPISFDTLYEVVKKQPK